MPNEIQTEPDAQAARLITQRLDEITKRARRACRRRSISAIGWYVCFIAGLFLGFRLISWGSPFGLAFVMLYFAAMLVPLFLIDRVRLQAMPKFDADEIARLGGVNAIAPLFVVLLSNMPKKQRQSICDALITLLPQMKATDAHLLTPVDRRMIHLWLNNAVLIGGSNPKFEDLYVASLKALEQVGDADAIPVVERLTKMKGRTPAQKKIKQAAIECLPMLLANCGEVETARTLLRASHSEAARPDTLLRAASGSAQSNPAELLRGAETPDK